MATRYTKEATRQLAPVYDQQIKGLQSQIPAIQNLYQTLTQGLQQQNQQQLNTGVQNIVEDASARGVLRSTLPVDARQGLTAQLGAALNEGLGKLGLEQTQQLGAVNQQAGQLRIDRAGAISQLANALRTTNLEERQLKLQKLQADREYKLKQQELAIARSASRGGGGGGRAPTNAQVLQGAASALGGELRKVAGRDGYVSPESYAAARREWGAAGFVDFDRYFGGFKNPDNPYYR